MILFDLEARFAKDVAERGGAAFADWFADDGVELGNAAAPVIGKVAIVKSATWSPKDYQLTWTPTDAMMGPSGDMGYTWGHYEGRSKDKNGNPVLTSGRYITMWRKQAGRQLEGRARRRRKRAPGGRRLLQAARTLEAGIQGLEKQGPNGSGLVRLAVRHWQRRHSPHRNPARRTILHGRIPRRFFNLLFGRPLATSEERAEHIGPLAGIPVFGLDALSSAAYGPEAALTLLIPLGLLGVKYIVPVSTAIVILLTIVYFSYRQTIEAYPRGGGSYTVASQNLGEGAGLLAAAALMIDYVLTAAVGISAGVGALISAVPSLQPHTLQLCLAVLALLTIVNMRGVHDTGVVFMIPTYLFTATLLIVIAVGAWHTVQAAGHPHPVTPLPAMPPVTAAVSWWLLLKVFSSGCTAMTGVEAVSNGVMAFREPTRKNAKATLTIIIALLAILLAGIALLCRAYGIAATDPGGAGYESVLSMLTRAVMGHGWFYYLTIASVLLVLALSANTAFADFPRLTRAIALDNYMPHVFLIRGRRLLYSWGIYVLVALTALLLIVFGGVTDRLIPLFAIGAFMAFTLSQAGMVMHWKRKRPPADTDRPRGPGVILGAHDR